MYEAVGCPLTFPDTVPPHMPVVSPANIAVHPLGLEVQVGGNSQSEAGEEPNQPVEDRSHLRPSFRSNGQDNYEKAQRHGSVPGNPASPAAAS